MTSKLPPQGIKEPSLADPKELTQYIYDIIDAWERYNFHDWELWELYNDCFEGWPEKDFTRIDSITKAKLRKYLIKHGVYMTRTQDKGKGNIAKQLTQPLDIESYHPWTPEEFNSWANPQTGSCFKIDSVFNPQDPYYSGPKSDVTQQTYDKIKNDGYKKSKGSKSKGEDDDVFSAANKSPDNSSSYENRPQPKNKQLESLIRLYKETDKYMDGTDSFDYKLMIFLDNYHNACVEPKHYASALTNMFALPARDVYLDATLNKFDMSFEQRCKYMKNHFETEPWRIRRENTWIGIYRKPLNGSTQKLDESKEGCQIIRETSHYAKE